MPEQWDINKIREILPQRYPFIFIDRVIEIKPKEGKVVCVKNVTINDYFFEGHFPDNPILPGAITLEAMAQASIILHAVLKPEIAQTKPDYYLAKVEIKYKNTVKPGDQLLIEVTKEKILEKVGIVKAIAKVKDQIAAEAEITFGVIAKK